MSSFSIHGFDNLDLSTSEEVTRRNFFRLFRLVGFGASSNKKWVSRVGFALLTLVTAFAILDMIYILIHIVRYSKFSAKYASYPVAFALISQLTFNLMVFYYFQYKGTFYDSQCIEIIQLHGAKPIIRRAYRLTILLGIEFLVCLICILVVGTRFNGADSVAFNYNDILPSRPLVALCARLLLYYRILVILSMKFYFICFTGIVCSALDNLNSYFQSRLKSLDVTNKQKTTEVLYFFFLEHLKLSKKIKMLDTIFGVFVLVYCVCTFPNSIFALWAMMMQTSWAHCVSIQIQMIMSLTWIVVLFTNPIRIRSKIQESKVLLLYNLEIWQEYNPRVLNVAKMFLAHLNEDQLGISIYGFVTISKPLILSFISVAATFLIFLVQTNYSPEASSPFSHSSSLFYPPPPQMINNN